jgi:hypothetical protein
MTFIEVELFHDKRTNLTVYEKLMSILLARSHVAFIEWVLFNNKEETSSIESDYNWIGSIQNYDEFNKWEPSIIERKLDPGRAIVTK